MEKQLRWVRRVSYRKAVSSDLNVSLPAQYIVDSPVEKVVTIQRNGWSQCSGMGGHNAAESVVTMFRNGWSQCSGIGGQFVAEWVVTIRRNTHQNKGSHGTVGITKAYR